VLAAAVTELFLLYPAAGLLHRLESEPYHMEGIQDGCGVFMLVADRVAVAAERIQRGGADPGGERLATGVQPVGVGLTAPARHQVQQPGVLVACRRA
jgi:hypothetical protein